MPRLAAAATVIAAVAIAAISGALSIASGERAAAPTPQPEWREAPWPFPMDPWGKGSAFRCDASRCGAELTIYLRAKIGFCNCTGGMADDAELERIGDLELLGSGAVALSAGRPVRVQWMPGRSRLFRTSDGLTVLSVGFHDGCDAMVATALLGHAAPETAERRAMEFLDSGIAADWARTTLGL